MKRKICLGVMLFSLLGGWLFAQDTRYDANLNLPFNQKAGDVNPQTGNISLSVTDLSLPGRGA